MLLVWKLSRESDIMYSAFKVLLNTASIHSAFLNHFISRLSHRLDNFRSQTRQSLPTFGTTCFGAFSVSFGFFGRFGCRFRRRGWSSRSSVAVTSRTGNWESTGNRTCTRRRYKIVSAWFVEFKGAVVWIKIRIIEEAVTTPATSIHPCWRRYHNF